MKERFLTMFKRLSSYHPFSVILVLLVLGACVFVMFRPHLKSRIPNSLNEAQLGSLSSLTLRADTEFDSVDLDATELCRKKAEENAPEYYRLVDDSTRNILKNFAVFCNDDTWIHRKKNVKQEFGSARISVFIPDFRKKIGEENFSYLKKALEDESFYEEFLQRLEKEILQNGIFKSSVASPKVVIIKDKESISPVMDSSAVQTTWIAGLRVAELLMKQYPDSDSTKTETFKKNLTKELEKLFHDGNVQRDDARTAESRKTAKESVKDVKRTFMKGEIVIAKGAPVTKNVRGYLKDYEKKLNSQETGDRNTGLWKQRIGKTALCIVFMLFSLLYLRASFPAMLKNSRTILNISVIALYSLLANYFAGLLFYSLLPQSDINSELVFLVIPLALPAILISSIYGIRASIFVGIFLSGIAAISIDNSFPVFATGMIVSAISGFAIRKISDYKKYYMTVFIFTALTTFFCGFIFLLHEDLITVNDWKILRDAAALSFVTGLVTPMLALALLFPLESYFDLASNMSYIGFTDRNHPLLKKLQQEAPGTYHHSERVASIAEKAADAIGVNPLLVQACALFHDIGKLQNPGMFTENSSDSNPLGDCSPRECVELIRGHVSNGLKLAKEYKLKSFLCRAIERHHGTDFISFFFDLAKKQAAEHPGQEPPREADFRYAGPLPDDRETALLSLADCAEAMTRSIPNPTREILEERLTKLFYTKLEHGQLDNAPLTAAELRIIRDSFVASLVAMNHVRIAYPTFKKEESAK